MEQGFKRATELGNFVLSARSPRITDVEIVACFADLRGFSNYVHRLQRVGQDNRVQHFLRSYFEVYPQAVLRALWDLEPDGGKEPSERIAKERALVVPTAYKNLGDGMMLVWELQGEEDMVIQGLATRSIVRIIEYIQEEFEILTSSLGPVEMDAYSRFARNLKLGFGVAKGHAWRLDFGRHTQFDYAGSIVNLAARLQGLARPEGIVAQLAVSESLFRGEAKLKNGRIEKIPPPVGFGTDRIELWVSKKVVLPKSQEKHAS